MTDNERNDKPTRFSVVLDPEDMALLLAIQAGFFSRVENLNKGFLSIGTLITTMF